MADVRDRFSETLPSGETEPEDKASEVDCPWMEAADDIRAIRTMPIREHLGGSSGSDLRLFRSFSSTFTERILVVLDLSLQYCRK